MKLTYDIDISYIMPEDVFADPMHAEMLKQTGIELNARGNYIAKFRNPSTAEALAGASDVVRSYFESCGFAFIPSGVQLPAGQFDAKFDSHVTDVVKRLEENLPKFDLPNVSEAEGDWNGFSLGELLVWFSQCTAVQAQTEPEWQPTVRRKSGPSLLHIGVLGAAAVAVYAFT